MQFRRSSYGLRPQPASSGADVCSPTARSSEARVGAVLLLSICSALCIAAFAEPLPTRPVLTLDTAAVAANACLAMAAQRGWRLAVSVVDRSGGPVLVQRMDDAIARAVEIAGLKASTAATVGQSTRDLRRVLIEEPSTPHGLERVPGIVVFDGGMPIRSANGYLVGGVGVSGATSAQDGECARAAVAAISDRL